jgi:small GTP-binding protein
MTSTFGIINTNKVMVIDGTTIRAEIWDTAGQERYRTITKGFYQQAHGLLLVYDATKPETFEKITFWLQSIEQHASPSVIKYLIANKVDKVEERAVSKQAGETLAQEYKLVYMETSARTGQNVVKMYESIFHDVLPQIQEGRGSLRIHNPHRAAPSRGRCCK